MDNKHDIINNNVVKRHKFPYEIKKVDENTNRELLTYFKGERTGFVQVGPNKWFFPSKYEREAENIYNFPVRKDDVWIVTFPRSGTTLTQEMVWMIANDCNFAVSANKTLLERFPFLEFSVFVHEECKAEFLQDLDDCTGDKAARLKIVEDMDLPMWEVLQETEERRFIKTHLPFSLLPPELLTSGAKIIYVARNAKDVATSFYHLNRLIRTQGYVGDFPRYWNYFENNLQPWTPYWKHINEGWNVRNNPNLLFLFYENTIKDMRGTIEKVSEFLNKTNEMRGDRTELLLNHLSIDNFKNNPSVNFDALKFAGILNSGEESFIRKGVVNGFDSNFDKELLKRANRWIEKNISEIEGLQFPN